MPLAVPGRWRQSTGNAYHDWLPQLPDEVLANWGRCRNPTLMRMIRETLLGVPVMATDAIEFDGDFKEAMALLIAHDSLVGYPTNVPGTIGAAWSVPLGKLTRLASISHHDRRY